MQRSCSNCYWHNAYKVCRIAILIENESDEDPEDIFYCSRWEYKGER